MRRALLVCTLLLSIAAWGQDRGALVITGVTVVDAAGARSAQTVVITGNHIAAAGPSNKVKAPKGARRLDGRGKYLIPGLWDAHVHLSFSGAESLPVFLAHGVTSVRDMGGKFEDIRQWRDEVAAGKRLGPRIKASGPILEGPAFLAVLEKIAQALPAHADTLRLLIAARQPLATAEDVPRILDALESSGADFIKLRTTPTRESFLALATEARQRKLRLAGHAPNKIGLLDAVRAGMDSIEHGLSSPGQPPLTPEQLAELAAAMKENTVFLTPTLFIMHTYRLLSDEETLARLAAAEGKVPPRMLGYWRLQQDLKAFEGKQDWQAEHDRSVAELRTMHKAGVRMLAGTDLGGVLIVPGASLHDELKLMVDELGLTPLEVLRSATLAPAEFFGMEKELGAIAEGKLADLVLLDADPLADIANTRRIHAVIRDGRLLERKELDRKLTTKP